MEENVLFPCTGNVSDRLTLSLCHTALLQLREEAQEEIEQVLGHNTAELKLLYVGLREHDTLSSDVVCLCVCVYLCVHALTLRKLSKRLTLPQS